MTTREHGPQGPAYTVEVKCQHVVGPKGKRCGVVRWCKPQDAFQVKRCEEHTKAYKAERAKQRRAAKAKERAAAKPKPAAKKPAKRTKAQAKPSTVFARAMAAVDQSDLAVAA